MSSGERVMLLIDADNVSVDVMEQALRLVHQQHGGVHVRRAYCTAESAVKHQAAFKRLAIKPMVNLAAGKNSTDIALAVDAIDLVLAERPDVVVIASSDSDFAPLVQRLREKGCVVRGIGQKGKTGAETVDVYDDFTVLEHRGGGVAAEKPARKRAAAKAAPAAKKAATKTEGKAAAKKASKAAPKKAATKAVAAKKTATRTTARKAVAVEEAAPETLAPAVPAAKAPRKRAAAKKVAEPALPPVPEPAAPPPAEPARPARADAEAVLACLPELAAGQALALNVAVQRLREARLLGKNTPSTKFFAALGERFELRPAGNPQQVLLRG